LIVFYSERLRSVTQAIFAPVKILIKAWSALYHIWYYVVIFVAIVVILPFIFITSQNEKNYNNFFWWSRIWGKIVLIGMGQFWRVKRLCKIDPTQTYIIIANHASELDIMMMLAIVPNTFVFIGKKELANIPLFGYFYKRTNILVDRKSLASKKAALKLASERLKEGIGVCIFPEGGIPEPTHILAPFKQGAFKLAIDMQLPILPITFANNGKNFPEFWDGGFPGILRATLHNPVQTTGMIEENQQELTARCYEIINNELLAYGRR